MGVAGVLGFRTDAGVGMEEVEGLVSRSLAADVAHLEGLLAAARSLVACHSC